MRLIFIILLLFAPKVYSEELYSAGSKERGIESFNFIVTEISREKSSSVLSIPNFQSRSALASRWMMCIYTEVAIQRGFKYWSSIYTDNSGDMILLVFPSSDSITDPAFEGVDLLGGSPRINPISTFKIFCGIG